MPQIQLQERSPSQNCPLCRAELGESQVVTCEACGTAFHAQCDAEFGSGCPTTGCSTAQRRVRVEPRITFATTHSESPEPGCLAELASLLLLAFGLLGAMLSGGYLYVEKRDLGPAKAVFLLCVVMVVAGWVLKPKEERS